MRLPISSFSSLKYTSPIKSLSILSHLNARPMSSSCTTPTTTPSSQPIFSSNTDAEQASLDLKKLLLHDSAEGSGRWKLIENGKGIERSFKFKTFKKTWEFMNLVASECSVQKHHPEWSNVYNTTFIRWTTHSPPGLSHKDGSMARFCDLKALECDEQVEEIEKGNETARGLVGRVVQEGGDCCVPKKKKVEA